MIKDYSTLAFQKRSVYYLNSTNAHIDCLGGEIGRRSRLKICRPFYGRAGSIPALGTITQSESPLNSGLFAIWKWRWRDFNEVDSELLDVD